MNEKSRLRWRCRRGIREMDILFQNFMDVCYDRLNPGEKESFEVFLDEADLDIFDWIMGRAKPTNDHYLKFITAMQNSHTQK